MAKFRQRSFIYGLGIPIIALMITGIVIFANVTSTSAQEPENPTATPEIPTPTATATSTPLPVERILQFNGTSQLNTSQPILSIEYIDEENNKGYSDASEVRIKEIGVRTLTNEVIWRIKIKRTNEIVEERFATQREVNAYLDYVEKVQVKEPRRNDLNSKYQNFGKLTDPQKDALLLQLLEEVLGVGN